MQTTLSLSRLGHERPEYLWLVLHKPHGSTPEPCGELRVRLQWAPAPLRKAGTGQGIGWAPLPHVIQVAGLAQGCGPITPRY